MHPTEWARIPGWLTDAQAQVLRDEAAAVPPGGVVVEIGSHHGRSTVVLAAAVPPGARVVAVDPFVPDWRYGGPDTEAALRANLAAAGVTDVVDVRRETSTAALRAWRGPLDLVWIDGKHDLWSVRHDLGWARHLPSGGHVLVHDAFGSVGVTLGLLPTLLLGRRLTYLGRTGSLARLVVRPPRPADRLRPLRELPWFARNLVIKALRRLRLRRDPADPY